MLKKQSNIYIYCCLIIFIRGGHQHKYKYFGYKIALQMFFRGIKLLQQIDMRLQRSLINKHGGF